MALEPITRKEKIIAGQDLTPITRMEMFLKQFGGGGSGGGRVQSDWNQNDDTQPDYVKNRPFYEAKQIVTVENVSDAPIEGFPLFAVGDTVTVNVDGVEHSLVAYEEDGSVTIGDTYNSINNGEGQLGWQIYFNDREEVMRFFATEAHTVSYFAIETVKIDEKYLPKPKAAFIICNSDTNPTYSSDLTYDELYARLLDGKQIVLYNAGKNECLYLTKWKKATSGRIDLAFAGDVYSVSLKIDGTIVKTPSE